MNSQKKILIVEDSEASVKLIQAHLDRSGYQTIVARSGMGGLAAAREKKPDLIVLDILLPDLGGHKVCRMIKFDRKLCHIPVVVWTSRDTEEDAETAKNCGADAFVVKSTKIQVLLEVIRKLIVKNDEKKGGANGDADRGDEPA